MADQLRRICWDAATRLFDCVKVHAAYAFKLEENLDSLQSKMRELEIIHNDVKERIERAESTGAMRRTNVVQAWLECVQNLQQQMERIEAQASQEIRNTCLSGYCPNNIVSSYKIGREVVTKTLEVDELETKGNRFLDRSVDIAHERPTNEVRDMPCGETVGLELMHKKVWNSLKDENVGIIGLYGMGGAGKTTLMKRVHNEFGKGEHGFELVLWTVVSKDGKIEKVMNDIRNKLRVQDDFWNISNNDDKAAKINQILKRKRFVLMLDDLWGKLELEKVGVPYPKETNCQSKVVLTTRSDDVCDKMQADKKFKVECLLEKEAFDLFCKKVGEENLKGDKDILELATEMVKECKGLPLALITVGSAMAGVKSIESWREAKNDLRSFPLTSQDLDEKVFSILKFSYDRLPDEAHKSCFLYCALYPEDYSIDVEGLIDRWIGEGFLDKGKYMSKRSTYEMRDEGRSIIEKLKLSSLLENASEISWELAIKMHDVIRDMALWLARDRDKNKNKVLVQREALVTDSERFNVTGRISMIGVKETWQQVPVCPNLLTMCVQGNLEIIKFSNLHYMTRLKVLDLSNNHHIGNLPIEIGKLINLEFLDISWMTKLFGTLPIELKNLKKLRVFLVEGTRTKIPLEVFEGLEQLQVFRCPTLEIKEELQIEEEKEEILLLEKLESLPNLEELGVDLQTITGMHKLLLNPNKLRGCVRTFKLSGIFKEPVEMASLLASLSKMKHLEKIELYELCTREISSITPTWHLDKLRDLNIERCGSITHLTWLRYAPLLECLGVNECRSMEEVVKGGQDEDDVGIDLFSKLRCLALLTLPKLNSIHKRALPFPSLKSIYIQKCYRLRKLPLNSNSAKDTLIEIMGVSEWWYNLEWDDPAAGSLFSSKFKEAY